MKPSSGVDFYFDFLSGYAYLAWRRLPQLCQKYGTLLRIHPVVFGVLLDHWGQKGPAEIPSKKAFVYRHGYRFAALHGFKFNPPKYHPFNPLPALRVSLAEVSGPDQSAVIDAIFKAGWSEGRDIGSPQELISVLDRVGLPGEKYLQRTQDPSIKEKLRVETAEAIQRGVFGVPTMILEEQLFWGNDQLEFLELRMQGKDPINEAAVQEMLLRPRGIDRKAATRS